MTPAEIRASILKLTEAVARIDALLKVVVKQQDDDQVALREFQAHQAEDRTRLALLERDADNRAKRDGEFRSMRIQMWIATFSAVATFVGSLIVAYLVARSKP